MKKLSQRTVHYALRRRRRPDKLNIFSCAQGDEAKPATREKFMETACERALNSLSWSLYYEPITCSSCCCEEANSSRTFHLHPKETDGESTRLPACRIPEQNERQSKEVSKEKRDDNAEIPFLSHCKHCISALVTIPFCTS